MNLRNLRTVFVFPVLFALIAPICGRADTVTIGTDTVSISVPQGHCPLDTSDPSDNRLIQYIYEANKGVNKVIMVFADCSQLQAWRVGNLPNLNDSGYVLAPNTLVNRRVDIGIGTYLSEMERIFKEQGVAFLEDSVESTEDVIEKHFPLVQLNETQSLGVISQDDMALYWGLIQNIQTEQGDSKYLVGVMAMTLVSGKAVNFYLWTKYQGKRTVYDLQELVSSWVSRIQQSN